MVVKYTMIKSNLYKNCMFLKDLNESGHIIPDILVTPEEIQQLAEQCSILSESIDFDCILQESFNIKEKAADVLDKDLKKVFNNNDKNYQKAKSAVKSTATSIASEIKSNGLKKESKSTISHKFEQLCKKLEELLFESLDTKKLENGKYDKTKIKNALRAVVYCLAINTVALFTFSIILGPVIGNFILCVIVAPLVEELCKKFAVSGGFEKEFSVLFNAYEMVTYVSRIRKMGIPMLKAIRIRTFTVLMHLTTTIVQWLSKNEKVQKFLHLKDEQSKTLGYFIGVFIHGAWNFLAATNNQKFLKMVIGN